MISTAFSRRAISDSAESKGRRWHHHSAEERPPA
jgi:hypothetical protein